jgi:outer membrane protein OmpA-like peptidoglycan-associated protein
VNLGYPVNTTGDDVFFNPGWDELGSYYAVPRADDPTSNTINMVMELEYEEELAESPVADSVIEEPGVIEEAVIPATITEVIEPEETDEIEEVLNRDARRPETEEVEPEVKPEVEIKNRLPVIQAQAGPGIPIPIMFETAIPFNLNSYSLNIPAQLETEKIAEIMDKHPTAVAELVGHTDATGSSQHNMLLSFQRAEAVAKYLEKKGIERKRILVDGKGDVDPLAKDRYQNGSVSTIGRYLNRQVRVRIADSTPLGAELLGIFVPKGLKIGDESSTENIAPKYLYTIQVGAARSAISKSRFEKLDQVTEYVCKDGYYRYATGSFSTFQEASDQVRKLRTSGFKDAYIQTLAWYERAMK